jgi:hypothetical protein
MPVPGTNSYMNDVRVGDTGPQNGQTIIRSRAAFNPNAPPKDPAHPIAERTPG